ncbi:hypothetical protein ACEZHJ_10665 [Arhodomonas sp. KWT2]|nr:hypothetical protein [Arhodomonas sp. KWT]
MDDDALNLLDVGMPPGEGEGEAGHLCVDPYSYIGDGSAMDAEPVGCIKLREEGDFTSVYIDYALKAQLNDTERRNIVDADPAGAFYIY